MARKQFSATLVLALLVTSSLVLILTPQIKVAKADDSSSNILVFALPGDPDTLNPSTEWSIIDHWPASLMFSALIGLSPTQQPIPELATNWTISSDGLTYTFSLRQGVEWSDGVPFTSADVKFSYLQALMKLHPLGSSVFDPVIQSIDTPDNYTVIFHLNKSFSPFLTYTSFITGAIIPAHIYNGTDILTNPHNFNDTVGIGPFMLQSWIKGSSLTLVPNPHWYVPGQPKLSKVVFEIIPSTATQLTAFESGAVDVVPNIPGTELQSYKAVAGANVTVLQTGFGAVNEIALNLRKAPLNNVEVRQALAHALNTSLMIQDVAGGLGYSTSGPISTDPALSFWHNPNAPSYSYNTTLAGQMLDQAGYPVQSNGTRFSLTLLYPTAEGYDDLAQIISQELQAIKIAVTLDPEEANTAYAKQFTAPFDFDMAIQDFSAGPNPFANLPSELSSKFINAGDFTNSMNYNNSQVDSLLTQGVQTSNRTQQQQIMWQVQALVQKDEPIIWLYEPQLLEVERTGLSGCTTCDPFWRNSFGNVAWTVLSTGSSTSTTSTQATGSLTSATSSFPPVSSSSTTTSSSSSNTTTLAIGSAIVVLIVIVIAVFALRRRPSPSSSRSAAPAAPNP